MPEKCYVHNCTAQAVSHGLCDKHRKRVSRHGTTQQTRPDDWGSREKHPAYKSWCGLIRHHKHNIPEEWHDFWVFVAQIPIKPSLEAKIYRPDKNKHWGINNFFWKDVKLSQEARLDRSVYMREWQRKRRAKNAYYSKNSDLKKTYGVDLQWYEEQSRKQNNLCMICQKPETAMIKGRILSLSVDHCHTTLKVRGLLCSSCNRGIGLMCDDPNILRKAADYLEKPSS